MNKAKKKKLQAIEADLKELAARHKCHFFGTVDIDGKGQYSVTTCAAPLLVLLSANFAMIVRLLVEVNAKHPDLVEDVEKALHDAIDDWRKLASDSEKEQKNGRND